VAIGCNSERVACNPNCRRCCFAIWSVVLLSSRVSPDHDAVTLRPATLDDARAVADIWHRGWRDGHLGNVPDALVAVRTCESFAVRAAQRVGDTVVAIVLGAVAGFVMVVEDEVEQVYVSTGHRGTGVASVLLAEAERLVAEHGHERAWLAVVPGNTRARRFYERSGWTDAGLIEYAATSDQGPVTVPCQRYIKRVSRRAG
jgi:ribosomal protein S18 acetylase RimI-like enzyme